MCESGRPTRAYYRNPYQTPIMVAEVPSQASLPMWPQVAGNPARTQLGPLNPGSAHVPGVPPHPVGGCGGGVHHELIHGNAERLAALTPLGNPLSTTNLGAPLLRSASGTSLCSGPTMASVNVGLTGTLGSPSFCTSVIPATVPLLQSQTRQMWVEAGPTSPTHVRSASTLTASFGYMSSPACISGPAVGHVGGAHTPISRGTGGGCAVAPCTVAPARQPVRGAPAVRARVDSRRRPTQIPTVRPTAELTPEAPVRNRSGSKEVVVEATTWAVTGSEPPPAVSVPSPKPASPAALRSPSPPPVSEGEASSRSRSRSGSNHRNVRPKTSVHDDAFANHYKTRLCANYAGEGKCKYGRMCRFAHGYSELRTYGKNNREGVTSVEALEQLLRSRLEGKPSK